MFNDLDLAQNLIGATGDRVQAIKSRVVDLIVRHEDKGNLHAFSDSTLNFGKTRSGKMYTPEQEFSQVSRQYALKIRTLNIAIGTTAVNIAQSIVSVLCQACSMGEDAEKEYFEHPERMPYY